MSNKLFKPTCLPYLALPRDQIKGTQNAFINGMETYVNVIFYDGTVLPDYYISNYRNVYSTKVNRLLSVYIDERGYKRVTLTGINTTTHEHIFTGVHKLELMSFFPIKDPNYYMPNHRDGNTSNNWLYNLEWMTPSENTVHALRTGLSNCKGENNSRSYISNDTVHKICQCLEKGIKTSDIATEIGYTKDRQEERNRMCAIIRNIKYGQTYKDIAEQYNFPGAKGRYTFSDMFVYLLCQFLSDGNDYTYNDLAEFLQIPVNERTRFRVFVDDVLEYNTATHITEHFDNLKTPSRYLDSLKDINY